ncbi:PqqD family protein [Sphingomonas sp. LHG3406-1]|uniref:PqqD family protein n=1 Tax=Sphingomonas sp. LHG3406-1 TaxID=2804617 RepID=UPI00260A1579|nr:PqqD family protein [Sphingomonas sp. LHG3406-1]
MTRFRHSPDALSADVGEDVVALQAVRGFAFGMEGVSASVWKLLDRARSISEIVADLLERFDVDPEECEADVAELLGQLEAEGLIEKVEA